VELTQQADYALRCVLEVARHGRLSAGEVARLQGLSPSFVAKIVSTLARAGVLETHRGAAGGVQLGRPASDISLLDVVQAVEGPIRLTRCVRTPPVCPIVDRCPLAPTLQAAQAALVDALDVTLTDVLDRDRTLARVGAEGTT
jgi:Rrf2 family transcriptional regulator, iron-responsive regulator